MIKNRGGNDGSEKLIEKTLRLATVCICYIRQYYFVLQGGSFASAVGHTWGVLKQKIIPGPKG